MQVRFLGVRGSTPAPGASFVRYGGNTSCVAVSTGQGAPPELVLDAGTGVRALGGLLAGAPFRGDILLTHLHWDHVMGLPFCGASDREDARVRVVMPAQGGRSGRDLLAQMISPPAFPITPEGLWGQWSFHAVAPGEVAPGPDSRFTVVACEVRHKGGRTFGYRVTDAGGRSLAYTPDHSPAAGVSPALRGLLAGVDVLVHDAQFLEAERRRADDYGHATVADAIALAAEVGAGTLVLFHHGPGRTDDELDEVAAQLRERSAGPAGGPEVLVAAEGMELEI